MDELPASEVSMAPRRPLLPHAFVETHRRRRYVDAAAELLHEFTRHELSVTSIVRLAGTARNSFYEVFDSADDCLSYGAGLASKELFAPLDALSGEGEWLAEVHAAITGFYVAAAAEPLLAELLLIHSFAIRRDSGEAAICAGIDRFAELLRRGRAQATARDHRRPPPLTEEYLSQAIVSLARLEVRRAEVQALPAQSWGVATLIGGVYLGSEETERILGRS